MKNNKKLIGLMLVLALLTSITSPVFAQSDTDSGEGQEGDSFFEKVLDFIAGLFGFGDDDDEFE